MINKLQNNFATVDYILSNKLIVSGCYENREYNKSIAAHKKEIDNIWNKEQVGCKHKLFNSKIMNMALVEEHREQVVLQCHPIEYKHYFAQRSGIKLGITPLAVSGIVFYRNNNTKIFVIGKRSEFVTQYPGYYEFIPSGSIDANDMVIDSNVKYKKQLMIELEEELGMYKEQVKSCNDFCLILDREDQVYDIGIEVEIENLQKIKIDGSEYSEIQTISEDLLVNYMEGDKIANTSRILFKAWIAQGKKGIK